MGRFIISGIYKIVCYNNKFYIGSSINIDKRIKDHIRSLNKNKHHNSHLQRAWNEYGENNFKFEVIETIHDISRLLIREKWWMDDTNCCNREIGFNISNNPHYLGIGGFIDLTGQRFGRLVVNKHVGKNKHGKYIWLCKCDCGKEKVVIGSNLKNGNTKSCGCITKEINNNFKHGHNRVGKESKTYRVWSKTIQRCYNKNYPGYKHYGGRDITVCNRWLDKKNGYRNFLADMGECPPGMSLDRINNDKLTNGYSPKNCRWATINRMNNHIISYNDKDQCITGLAEEHNIGANTLRYRLYVKKMSIEEALMIPIGKYKRNKE